MKAIPVKIPGDAAQLHLSYNSITEVKDGYLYELRDLQKLDLSHNAIEVPSLFFYHWLDVLSLFSKN